jgi:hypothetical protein
MVYASQPYQLLMVLKLFLQLDLPFCMPDVDGCSAVATVVVPLAGDISADEHVLNFRRRPLNGER